MNKHYLTTDFDYYKSLVDSAELFEVTFGKGIENNDTIKIFWRNLFFYDTITEFNLSYSSQIIDVIHSQNFILTDSLFNKSSKIKIKKERLHRSIQGIIGWDKFINCENDEVVFIKTIRGGIKIKY